MSRLAGAFVIARNTAFIFKGKAVDIRQVTRELGVRYALEGSVRKSGQNLRVTAQLVNGATGATMWAEKFDRKVAELFALQDAIVADLATTLNAKLIEAESRRSIGKPNPDAVELIMQAKATMNRGLTEGNLVEAIRISEVATERDSNNVEALTNYAVASGFLASFYRFSTARTVAEAGEAITRRGLTLAPDHARCRATLAMTLRMLGRYDESEREYEEALGRDENYLWAYNGAALTSVLLGKLEQAEGYLKKAIKLSPRDPFIFNVYGSLAAIDFLRGDFESALGHVKAALKANSLWPTAHCQLIATYGFLGRLDDAARAIKAYGAVAGPKTIIAMQTNIEAVFGGPTRYGECIYEGLRRAGFPEQ